jgi:DNA processing protein
MTDVDALLILNHLRVGPITGRRLMDRFGSPAAIFTAGAKELAAAANIASDNVQRILQWEREVKLDKVWEIIRREQIRLLTYADADYPPLLREIYDYPLLLYSRGTLAPQESAALGVVGTRMPTAYGSGIARKWSAQLAARGFTIVSGLARGVDTQAHLGALEAKGRTIAVLGYGFGYVYPRENERLFNTIVESGLVVTEYPYKRYHGKASFPLRNRLIAGLSRALLVVESRNSGGAMITAHFANEYNRTVFAVPGSVHAPASSGTNRLIRDGATLTRSVADILDEFSFLFPRADRDAAAAPPTSGVPAPQLSDIERQLYEILLEPLTMDDLAHRSDISIEKVTGAMLMLELKGLVRALPGKIYDRT